MKSITRSISRRSFVQSLALGSTAMAAGRATAAENKVIRGFEESPAKMTSAKSWKPVSDRRIRVGIGGYGVCKFGSAFSFQDHPNVEVVAVSDLSPERCAELAKVCRCTKAYPSVEEMIKDDHIEAVFLATDAPSHCRLA